MPAGNRLNKTSEFKIGESVATVTYPEGDWTIESTFHEIYECHVYRSPNCQIMPGDTVIDGGAHYGLFALYAALAGASRIICFEPSPEIFVGLQNNLEANLAAFDLHPSVEYYDKPLWAGESVLDFYIVEHASAGSRIVQPGLRKRDGSVAMKTMSVDSLNLQKVDLIKLDIEGAELQALIGMEQTIKRCRPKLMISMYHHHGDRERLPRIINSFGMNYKSEMSTAVMLHVTGFFY